MPLYEYICLDCKTRFDVLRAMKDSDSPLQCIQCDSDHTSRLISLLMPRAVVGWSPEVRPPVHPAHPVPVQHAVDSAQNCSKSCP